MREPEIKEALDLDGAETTELVTGARELHRVVDECLCELLEVPLADRSCPFRLTASALSRRVVEKIQEMMGERI